jgi:acetolactate synthase I/II/III large subunit
MSLTGRGRIGADLAIETLANLGVDAAFGVPGVHALANWEAMRTAGHRYLGARTELGAAFAADGYARAGGRPAALLLSTGPGALISLAGLMEAASSYVPVIAIASQIESSLIGRGRGALHELLDQAASFAPVVKWTGRASDVESIATLMVEAWEAALEPPGGPTFLEIPVDLLNARTDAPPLDSPTGDGRGASVGSAADVEHAVELLEAAREPVIWAGGGVIRAGAWDELRALAERLDAPVLTTYMGKGAIPESHPLAGGSACDEEPFKRMLRAADVVLCVGTELGEEPTSGYSVGFEGSLIQVDASPSRIGATYPAVPVIGDARAILASLHARLADRRVEGRGPERAALLRGQVEDALAAQGRELERDLLRRIRSVLPENAVHCWDMTILSYWAARDFPALRPRRFLYPVGSGTLGYAWPAAIGAAVAEPGVPALAVVGDGGLPYALSELASARQAEVNATLLVVDDGGYGILREYQRSAYGATHGVDLVGPDLLRIADAFEVPARATSPEGLGDDLAWAIGQPGPTMLVLAETLRPPTTMS